ncbi:MAG: site-specific integrase [Lachnospiraceae bacterium]|nr:site-specific integrase [Lachnospiraceae bacterium]
MPVYITPEKISYFIYMLNQKNKNANTIAAYSNNIKKLVLFLDGSELSKEQMYAYREWLNKSGLKKRTINAYISAANCFCEIMGCHEIKIELEHLPYEEFQNTMQIPVSNYRKIIYMALQNNNERLAMIIQVLCHTDLRFCELQYLTAESIEKGYTEVIRKHEKVKLFIPDVVLRDLKEYMKHQKILSGMIFCTRNGSMVNRSNFRKELKRICILAGIDETKVSIQNVKNVVLDSCPYYKLS